MNVPDFGSKRWRVDLHEALASIGYLWDRLDDDTSLIDGNTEPYITVDSFHAMLHAP